MKSIIKHLFFVACFLIAFTSNVYAYLDPSSATYIIQIVAGVFVVIGMTIGITWHRIKKFFKGKERKEVITEEIEDIQDENLAD